MYQNVEIEALDHYGRGLTHIQNKVVFVPNALPGEIVDLEIVNNKKSYSEAKVLKYIRKSSNRVDSKCPYFEKCGGCNFLNMAYAETLGYKLNKVKELLVKNKIDYNKDIVVIENKKSFNYRNKISLKIVDGVIGFYQDNTHDLVEINNCLIANFAINKVIENYKMLNIKNGKLTIRCNLNNEILLVINSDEKNYDIELGKLKELVKLVGIVYNDKTIYGDNFLYERIGGLLFRISYNSFFQVNPYITEHLFNLIEDNIGADDKVLDLYCGVGTLSLVASKKAREVIGVEIIENAILNGIFNAKVNQQNNVKFMLGDVAKIVDKLDFAFDTLIVDPPRKGLDKNTVNFIKEKKFKKIIYISCDANTLMRDLKYLEEYYRIEEYKILDMFSYSYHLESLCVISRL